MGVIKCKGYDPFQAWTNLSCNACDGGIRQGTPFTYDYYIGDDNACQLYCLTDTNNNQESDPMNHDIDLGWVFVETQSRSQCYSLQ